MSSELIGDIAEGALTGRAVEPDHGEGADGQVHGHACLNCGESLLGKHCHSCGQAGHVHKSLSAFFHDFIHGVFHFEGKIWRTLPALVLRPGKMTRAYIDGKRASYVSPIALFLFCVFLMFAVVKQFGIDFTNAADVNVNGKHVKGMAANQAEIARLQQQRATLVAQHQPTDAVDGEIKGRQEGIAALEKIRNPIASAAASRSDKPMFETNVPGLRDLVRKASSNPQLMVFKMQSNAYKFAWLLIPISVPFIWLLFPFSRRFGLYDHTVFVTYSLCFMLILTVIATLGLAAGLPGMATLIFIAVPLHIYKQVKYTYGLTWFGAVWRTLAISTYAGFALGLFTMVLIVLGVME